MREHDVEAKASVEGSSALASVNEGDEIGAVVRALRLPPGQLAEQILRALFKLLPGIAAAAHLGTGIGMGTTAAAIVLEAALNIRGLQRAAESFARIMEQLGEHGRRIQAFEVRTNAEQQRLDRDLETLRKGIRAAMEIDEAKREYLEHVVAGLIIEDATDFERDRFIELVRRFTGTHVLILAEFPATQAMENRKRARSELANHLLDVAARAAFPADRQPGTVRMIVHDLEREGLLTLGAMFKLEQKHNVMGDDLRQQTLTIPVADGLISPEGARFLAIVSGKKPPR